MNEMLKGKIFGMPRWLFFSMLAAGVIGGLYLRNKNAQAAAAAEGEAEDGSGYDSLTDPSLAGMGSYPVGSGGGSSDYGNSYAQDLLSQLLGGSGTTSDDVLAELQDYQSQQADYSEQLQAAIAARDDQLAAKLEKAQAQNDKKIAKLEKKVGKGGGGATGGRRKKKKKGKGKKPKARASLISNHSGTGMGKHKADHHPPQGRSRQKMTLGRNVRNTPTGGGPPAHPPHRHLPVHHGGKKRR